MPRRPLSCSTLAISGTARSGSSQCHADDTNAASALKSWSGMASPRPAEYVHPGRSRRQHRAHPVVWLDRDHATCHRCDRSARSVTFVTLTFLDRASRQRSAIAPDKPPRGQA